MSARKQAKPGPEDAGFPGGKVAPEAGELRVALDREPYAEIIGHAILEPDVEVCGVLVGRLGEDERGAYLHVRHAIRGQAARQEGAAVTFTHETWNHIHQQMDERFPEEQIVGWYHTHGGFGVFLSEMDTFVHQNFFPEPHHLAYVYDPLAGSEGFFLRQDGELKPIRRYWLGGRERKPAMRQPEPEPVRAKPGGADAAAAALERAAAALQSTARERPADTIPGGPWLPWLVAAAAVMLWLVGPRLQGGTEPQPAPAGPLLVVDRDPATGAVIGLPVEPATVYGAGVVVDARGTLRQALELRSEGGALVAQLKPLAQLLEAARAEERKRAAESAVERASLLRILWIAAAVLAGVVALGGAAWFFVLRRR